MRCTRGAERMAASRDSALVTEETGRALDPHSRCEARQEEDVPNGQKEAVADENDAEDKEEETQTEEDRPF